MASAGAVPAGTGASAAVGGPCKHNSGGCRRITQRGGTAQALINGGHRLCHSRHRRRRTGVVWHLRSRAKPSTTSLGDTRARVQGMHTTELCPTRSTQTVDGKQQPRAAVPSICRSSSSTASRADCTSSGHTRNALHPSLWVLPFLQSPWTPPFGGPQYHPDLRIHRSPYIKVLG